MPVAGCVLEPRSLEGQRRRPRAGDHRDDRCHGKRATEGDELQPRPRDHHQGAEGECDRHPRAAAEGEVQRGGKYGQGGRGRDPEPLGGGQRGEAEREHGSDPDESAERIPVPQGLRQLVAVGRRVLADQVRRQARRERVEGHRDDRGPGAHEEPAGLGASGDQDERERREGVDERTLELEQRLRRARRPERREPHPRRIARERRDECDVQAAERRSIGDQERGAAEQQEAERCPAPGGGKVPAVRGSQAGDRGERGEWRGEAPR